jgi:hypothetical protein
MTNKSILVLSMFILSGCGATDPDAETVTIGVTGVVRAEATGQAIAGAAVSLRYDVIYLTGGGVSDGLASTTTDADGRYSLSYSGKCRGPGADLAVHASATGYSSTNLGFGISIECKDGLQTLDINLSPPLS